MRVINLNQKWTDLFKDIVLNEAGDGNTQISRFVNFLVKWLEVERKTKYHFISRPDMHNHHKPQPDFLYSEDKTKKLLAIEYMRIFESEKKQKQTGWFIDTCDERGNVPIFPITNVLSPQEFAARMKESLKVKLAKGQFQDFTEAEQIVLARCISFARLKHFNEAKQFLIWKEPLPCSHFYIIVNYDLLEMF